jgi:hypothetical protein
MCKCCGSSGMNRRTFLGASAALTAAGLTAIQPVMAAQQAPWTGDLWNPNRPYHVPGKTLRVQPVLMYNTSTPVKQRSYKSWGDVQSHDGAKEEAQRIEGELKSLKATAGFPVEFLPVILGATPEAIENANPNNADATILYPATGGGQQLRAGMNLPNPVIFARHRSGATYYWYESLSVNYLRTDRPDVEAARTDVPKLSVHDVVIDDLEELRWRLRVLYAIHNTMGARILAIGGVMGKYASNAPQVAKDVYKMEMIDYGYEQLEPRIKSTLADAAKMKLAEKWTSQYLAMKGTTLDTDRGFLVNCFALYGLFKEIMAENDAPLFTIRNCMSAIMPVSNTTACLTLSFMNDEGILALCESDFVVVPPATLLYYLCDAPVFMHNSTFPHGGVVTCAHCTGPRRMNGDRYEPARIVTHYESEYGAAPKVDMPIGQQLSFINPEYAVGRWVGLRGEVLDNPFLQICRSQQDVKVEGDWKKLLSEVRDSHWLMVYGDKLRDIGYAAQRIGIQWDNISDRA